LKKEEHEQLLTTLSELRQLIAGLETSETERERAEQLLHEAEERLEREIAGHEQAEAALVAESQRSEEFDAQRRIATRQTALYRVLRAVTGQSDPIYVARAAVEAITKVIGWPNVVVAAPSEEETYWVVYAASGTLAPMTWRRFPIEQGVIGRALRTAETQVVPDVNADPDYVAGNPSIRSELAVPLERGGRTLGVLNLESDRLAAFGNDDVQLAESIADTVALALDNAHLYSRVHQSAANLSALYTVTRLASQSLVLEDVLSQALSSALTSLGFEAGLISLTDPSDGGLLLAAEQGLPPNLLEDLNRQGLEDTLYNHVHIHQESLILDDLGGETPVNTNDLAGLGFHTYAGIPLLHRGQSLGSMSLLTRRRRPSLAEELTLLTSIGNQVATAVANARLFETIAEQHSRLRALIESSRDGIIMVGTDLCVLLVNTQALELLHLEGKPEDWTGRSVQEVLAALKDSAPGMVESMLAEMRRVQQGDERPGEGEYEVPPRTLRWLDLPVLTHATPLGRLLVLRDVTEERLLEQMREDLTHTMVHDLRSPLTAIYAGLHLLGDREANNFSERQNQILNVSLEGTEKMLGLVNNILDVSRLEGGRMELQRRPVCMAESIDEALRAQSPLATEKDLRLESHVPPELPKAWADAGLVGRVLQNLVNNAIKFTPKDGAVKISAGPCEAVAEKWGAREGFDPAQLCVSVEDDGRGISPDLQSRLFQKFVTSRHEGSGSGLGLAFCKLAVEAHGGRIWVESEPDKGTTFTFTLPVAREE
jgi:NtrC-family two-component system sensor histidine kinase KinB